MPLYGGSKGQVRTSGKTKTKRQKLLVEGVAAGSVFCFFWFEMKRTWTDVTGVSLMYCELNIANMLMTCPSWATVDL